MKEEISAFNRSRNFPNPDSEDPIAPPPYPRPVATATHLVQHLATTIG